MPSAVELEKKKPKNRRQKHVSWMDKPFNFWLKIHTVQTAFNLLQLKRYRPLTDRRTVGQKRLSNGEGMPRGLRPVGILWERNPKSKHTHYHLAVHAWRLFINLQVCSAPNIVMFRLNIALFPTWNGSESLFKYIKRIYLKEEYA